MSKFTELRDVRAAALAREQRKMDEARRFCSELSEALALDMEIGRDAVFYIKTPESLPVDVDQGRIVPENEPLVYLND